MNPAPPDGGLVQQVLETRRLASVSTDNPELSRRFADDVAAHIANVETIHNLDPQLMDSLHGDRVVITWTGIENLSRDVAQIMAKFTAPLAFEISEGSGKTAILLVPRLSSPIPELNGKIRFYTLKQGATANDDPILANYLVLWNDNATRADEAFRTLVLPPASGKEAQGASIYAQTVIKYLKALELGMPWLTQRRDADNTPALLHAGINRALFNFVMQWTCPDLKTPLITGPADHSRYRSLAHRVRNGAALRLPGAINTQPAAVLRDEAQQRAALAIDVHEITPEIAARLHANMTRQLQADPQHVTALIKDVMRELTYPVSIETVGEDHRRVALIVTPPFESRINQTQNSVVFYILEPDPDDDATLRLSPAVCTLDLAAESISHGMLKIPNFMGGITATNTRIFMMNAMIAIGLLDASRKRVEWRKPAGEKRRRASHAARDEGTRSNDAHPRVRSYELAPDAAAVIQHVTLEDRIDPDTATASPSRNDPYFRIHPVFRHTGKGTTSSFARGGTQDQRAALNAVLATNDPNALRAKLEELGSRPRAVRRYGLANPEISPD